MKFEATKMPPRVLICGEPASGKTGALAQLSNAGYRLLIHDFDANARVIDSYLKPDAAPIYISTYAISKLTGTNLFTGNADATQKALQELRKFTKALEHWKVDGDDLGPSSGLTAKDVVVIDSGTFLGDLLLLAAHEDPKTKKDMRSLYQVAGEYYGAILDYLTGPKMGASVLVLTHLMQTGDKDGEGKFIGKPRDIPVGVGEKFSKKMQTYFSDIWHLEVGRTGERTFNTAATNTAGRRTSAPNKIKATEPFDLARLFNFLTEA
jgi:hypothetical protein